MDPYYSYLAMMIGTFANRMHFGPPLTEPEFCLYQAACLNMEKFARLNSLHLEKYIKELEPKQE